MYDLKNQSSMSYDRQCQHPVCTNEATDKHHIIFRSHSRKKAIDDEWNFAYLCRFHHTGGAESPHQSNDWRIYYEQSLPEDWKKRLDDCTESKRTRKINWKALYQKKLEWERKQYNGKTYAQFKRSRLKERK